MMTNESRELYITHFKIKEKNVMKNKKINDLMQVNYNVYPWLK